MSEQKQKQQVLIRLRTPLWDELFDEAARAQLERKQRVTVPSLVVEQLELVSFLKHNYPEIYVKAKAVIEQSNKS